MGLLHLKRRPSWVATFSVLPALSSLYHSSIGFENNALDRYYRGQNVVIFYQNTNEQANREMNKKDKSGLIFQLYEAFMFCHQSPNT